MHNKSILSLLAVGVLACTTLPDAKESPSQPSQPTKQDTNPAAVCEHFAALVDRASPPIPDAAREKERCLSNLSEHREEPCYEPFAACILSKQTAQEVKSCKEAQRSCKQAIKEKEARDKEERRTASLCPKLEQLYAQPIRGTTAPGYVRRPFRKESCPRDANAEWGPFLIACAEIAGDYEYYSYCKDKMIHPLCVSFIEEVERICEDPRLPAEGKVLCKEPQEVAANLRGGSMPEPPGADSDIFCKDDAALFGPILQKAKAMLP